MNVCRRRPGLAWLVIPLFFLSACAGPSAPERFYALGNGGAVVTRAPGSGPSIATDAPGILVSAVTVPELVDRPQIVTRDADRRVIVSEQHLWAESVRAGVARTLAERLERALLDAGRPLRVGAYPQNSIIHPALRITVDIARFDAEPNGTAVVEALWSVRRVDDQLVRSARTVASAPVDGADYEAIVGALDKALGVVDRDIAATVLELTDPRSTPPAPR